MAFGGYGTTCAIDDSNVRCWGNDTLGEVGNGIDTVYPVLTPTLVTLSDGTTPLAGIVDIKGGGQINVERDFACALSTDHDMYCWGAGYQSNPSLVASNELALGAMDTSVPRYLTSDGGYHIGQTTRIPSCGPLP